VQKSDIQFKIVHQFVAKRQKLECESSGPVYCVDITPSSPAVRPQRETAAVEMVCDALEKMIPTIMVTTMINNTIHCTK
jgi:hypothetical protein